MSPLVGEPPGGGSACDPNRAAGFTMVELLVTVAIIALLVSMMLPALGTLREKQDRMVSLSNLRECSNALEMVAGDNNGVISIPTNIVWVTYLWPYVYPNRSFPAWVNDSSNLKGTIFYDPGVRNELAQGQTLVRSFAINSALYSSADVDTTVIRLLRVSSPASTCLLGTVKSVSVLKPDTISFRYARGTLANFVFFDGHAEALDQNALGASMTNATTKFWRGQ